MTNTVTPPFQTHSAYLEYVEMVAENALEQEVSPRTAAESVVVDMERIDGEMAINISAEPYVDNPQMQERLWPKDVVHGAMREMPEHVDDLRTLAVEVLKRDLYRSMMEVERWEHRRRSVDAHL